jgi:hypothetical protein
MNALLRTVSLLSLAGAAFGATWNGTLVDVMCKGQDLASHTRDCALNCSKSGFALITADGTFYKLDETGNARALAALKASKKDKDLKAKVTGTAKDGVIGVESLELEP